MPHVSTSQALLFGLSVAALLAAPGCRRASGALPEPSREQMGRDVVGLAQDAGSLDLRAAGNDRQTIDDGPGITLPTDFPADVFLPEERIISSALDMGETKAVNVATATAPAQVSADVEQGMQAQGWKREMAMQSSATNSTLIYTKDDRQAIYQMIRADNGGTRLAVRIGGG